MAAHGGDARALGQAVARDDLLEPEALPHLHDHLDGDGGRAGHGEPQRRHVEAVEVGVVQDRLIDRGRAGEHRDPVDGHPVHDLGDVEHRMRQHRRPLHQAGEDAGVQAERVEERVDDQVAIALFEPDHGRPRVVPTTDRRVREHRPLRGTGGARREHDVAEGRRRSRQPNGRSIGVVDQVGPSHEVGEGRAPVGDGARA